MKWLPLEESVCARCKTCKDTKVEFQGCNCVRDCKKKKEEAIMKDFCYCGKRTANTLNITKGKQQQRQWF